MSSIRSSFWSYLWLRSLYFQSPESGSRGSIQLHGFLTELFYIAGCTRFWILCTKENRKSSERQKMPDLDFRRFCHFAILPNTSLCFAGVYKTYKELMMFWNLNILAVCFDITFLLQDNEDFGRIVGRNIIVKVLLVILIFTIVKKTGDVYLYVLLTSLSTLIENHSLWFYLPKYLTKIRFTELRPIEQSKKLVKMCITIIGYLGTIMMPKNSILYALDKKE